MITPRLPVYQKIKPWRPPERKAVTIAAGFRFDGGLILCADTQETIGTAKVSVPKLILEPSQKVGNDSPDDLMIAVAGAGDGPFIDKLIERAWSEISVTSSLDDACSQFERSIKATHREYGRIFQPGFLPQTELVCGLKMQGRARMFVTTGPVVNEKSTYCSVGLGNYMADFLARRMHFATLTRKQCLILAAYILFQCKEHVAGCGGESHIAVLDSQGKSARIGSFDADRVSKQIDFTESIFGALLINSGDLDLPDVGFRVAVNHSMKRVYKIREESRKRKPDYESLLACIEAEELEQSVKKQIFKHLRPEKRSRSR